MKIGMKKMILMRKKKKLKLEINSQIGYDFNIIIVSLFFYGKTIKLS